MPETIIVRQSDGFDTTIFHWEAADAARGVVQLAHGMGEYSMRYDRFAQALTAAGYHVYASEHRGHGAVAEATGTFGQFGPEGFPRVAQDLEKVAQAIRTRHPALPLIVFGHSMGSFIVQAVLLDSADCFDAVVLSGSAAVDQLAQVFADDTGGDPFLKMNDAFQPAKSDFDWLSRDEAEVRRYIEDPLTGFVLDEPSFGSLLAASGRLADPQLLSGIRADLPILILSGDTDPVGGAGKFVRTLYERYVAAGLKRVTLKLYPGGRHEMLNETNRDEVVADVIDWLSSLRMELVQSAEAGR